jgi:hypothetical protein
VINIPRVKNKKSIFFQKKSVKKEKEKLKKYKNKDKKTMVINRLSVK